MTASEPTPAHQCRLTEETTWGRVMLGPCTVCGQPASSVLEQLRGDKIRRVVQKFLKQGPRYMRASVGAKTTHESDQWKGQAEARGELLEQLQEAGVDIEFAPVVTGPSTPSPRHAQAVRDLHVLETIDDGMGGGFSSCKADGHITDDLETDPCPTLRALNQTDPAPVRPIVDVNKLAAAIFDGMNAALCNGGMPETGWSMIDEARRIANTVADNLPTVDLNNPVVIHQVGLAITHPSMFTTRRGSVPDHQVDAVIAALRKALK